MYTRYIHGAAMRSGNKKETIITKDEQIKEKEKRVLRQTPLKEDLEKSPDERCFSESY